MFQKLQKTTRLLIVFIFGSFTIFFLGLAWFVFGFHSEDREVDTRVALWMEHSWSRGTEKDFYELIDHLETLPVTDLYFHVGPLEPSGELADDLKLFVPGLETLKTTNYAWIGQIRSEIDLDNPEVRTGIIDSSRWILEQGFDGIHIDIEPVYSNDEGFFLLLEEMRTALPDAKLSVAMDEWQPHLLSKLLGWLVQKDVKSYWTTRQIRRTAQLVDQLTVMTYDTRFRDPLLYTWWVEQQTIAMSKIIPRGTELFIGIPAYEEGSGIHPHAENLATGITGYHRGITNLRSRPAKIHGIAIYSYWEMDDTEWVLIEEL